MRYHWAFLRVAPYFDEPVCRVKIQTTPLQKCFIKEQCFAASLYIKNVFNLIIKARLNLVRNFFFLASMFLVVYNLNSRNRNLAKQLRFNQMVARAKTLNTSAVKWVAMITCVFLSCYGIMMRCSLLLLTDNQSCNDSYFKIPLRVINSGINPIAYAFFKRDIQQECGRLLFKKRTLFNNRVVPTQEKH